MEKIKELKDKIENYLDDNSEDSKSEMMKYLFECSQFIIERLQELNAEELQVYTVVLNDILESEKYNDRVLLRDTLSYGMMPLLDDYMQIID